MINRHEYRRMNAGELLGIARGAQNDRDRLAAEEGAVAKIVGELRQDSNAWSAYSPQIQSGLKKLISVNENTWG